MNTIETIIDDYLQQYGSKEELEIHQAYKGNYLHIFSANSSDLEESVEFGGLESFLFATLVYILETVGKAIIKDGYEFSKENILSYLSARRDKSKSDEIDEEVIKNLIKLLQKEIKQKKQ